MYNWFFLTNKKYTEQKKIMTTKQSYLLNRLAKLLEKNF